MQGLWQCVLPLCVAAMQGLCSHPALSRLLLLPAAAVDACFISFLVLELFLNYLCRRVLRSWLTD